MFKIWLRILRAYHNAMWPMYLKTLDDIEPGTAHYSQVLEMVNNHYYRYLALNSYIVGGMNK